MVYDNKQSNHVKYCLLHIINVVFGVLVGDKFDLNKENGSVACHEA